VKARRRTAGSKIAHGDPAARRRFREGEFAIQGPFAAKIAPLVAPKPGERILDLCARPAEDVSSRATRTERADHRYRRAYARRIDDAREPKTPRTRQIDVVRWN